MGAEGEVKVIITGEETVSSAAQMSTSAIGDLGKESEKTGPKIEGLSGHGRELHRVASLMNRILPGSGEAIKGIAHSTDGTALALIGLVAVMETVIEAMHRMEAGAKAADESLAQSMTEGGSINAINAQKKAWEDAEIEEAEYHHKAIDNEGDLVSKIADAQVEILKKKQEAKDQELKDEIAIRENELKIKQGQIDAINADENAAANKARAAQGDLAKHNELVKTYTDNIVIAKEASKASGVTADDEQEIRQAYERMSGKPGAGPGALDLGAQADYVRKSIYTDTTGTLSDNLHIANLFSDFAGGRGLNDASFASYDLAQNDIRRNQGQLDTEGKKDFDLRLNSGNAKTDLEAARKAQTELFTSIQKLTDKLGELKGVTPSFPAATSTGPSSKLPYQSTPEGQARFDWNQIEGAHNILAEGGKLNADQTTMIQSILSAATGHSTRQDKILQALNTMLDTQKSKDAAFDSIQRQIENLRSRTPPMH